MRHTFINKLTAAAMTVTLLLLLSVPCRAFTEEQRGFITKVLSHYNIWNRVELNGKLRMSGLPVSPTVRIYMERDSKLMMSVRVPFMGEVGRFEVNGDTLLVVNKINKIYIKESMTAARDKVPLSLEAIQDIFLGRVYLYDCGTLKATNASMMTLSKESDCWLILPMSQPADGLVQYGYTMNFDGSIQDLYCTTISDDYSALVEYNYLGKKISSEFTVVARNKTYNATLELDEPRWTARAMEPMAIKRDWRRVTPREFIKVFASIRG